MEKDLYYNIMSTKTKNFIQKICYKRTASVDMTQFGFINDSKLYPANILLKPLREQLKKICGKPDAHLVTRKTSPINYAVKHNMTSKRCSKRRRLNRMDKANKEQVIRTEDLIARRQVKRAAEILAASEQKQLYALHK